MNLKLSKRTLLLAVALFALPAITMTMNENDLLSEEITSKSYLKQIAS